SSTGRFSDPRHVQSGESKRWPLTGYSCLQPASESRASRNVGLIGVVLVVTSMPVPWWNFYPFRGPTPCLRDLIHRLLWGRPAPPGCNCHAMCGSTYGANGSRCRPAFRGTLGGLSASLRVRSARADGEATRFHMALGGGSAALGDCPCWRLQVVVA